MAHGVRAGVERMGKKVLVVDDDCLVRLILCHYLEGMGCGVQEVESGTAALELFGDRGTAIDAVLTDLRLPDMHGLELARRAQGNCPFIFMTGGLVPPSSVPGPMLQKPFDEAALRAALSNILTTPAVAP
jgi:CheY-like chemotaxis protein